MKYPPVLKADAFKCIHYKSSISRPTYTLKNIFIYLLSVFGYVGPYVPRGRWDLSSLTRDWTSVFCTERWILNHWTTREVLTLCFWIIKKWGWGSAFLVTEILQALHFRYKRDGKNIYSGKEWLKSTHNRCDYVIDGSPQLVFWGLNMHTHLQRLLLKFRFLFSRSGVEPEILHF